MKRIIRILIYEGDEKFIEATFQARAVKGIFKCFNGTIKEYLCMDELFDNHTEVKKILPEDFTVSIDPMKDAYNAKARPDYDD